MSRAIAFAVVLAVSATAVAQPEPLTPPSLTPPSLTTSPTQTRQVRKWYGHKVLLADLASLGLLITGLALEDGDDGGVLVILGAGGLWLGAPALHLAHDQPNRAVYSFFARPALPVVGAYLGYQLENCDENPGEWCGLGGFLLGGFVGALTAIVVDAAIAFDEVKVVPVVQPTGAGTTYGFGVAASF